MAVAFDAVGPSSAGTSTSGTSLSWSHTCGGSANYLTVVTVNGSTAKGADTCTYAGVSMTLLKRVYSAETTGPNSAGYVSLWGLASPATGVNTVLFSAHASDTLIGGSVSYNGVGSVGTAVASDGNGTTAPTIAVTGTTSGGMVAAGGCAGSAIGTASQTSRWLDNVNGSTAANNGAQQDAASTGGTVTLSWNNPFDFWGTVAVELLPGGGGGGAPALPPAGARRSAYRVQGLPPSRRFRQTLPVPRQLNPPYQFSELAQHRETWPRGLPRRARATFVVPPQLNPPYPFAELRQQRRPRGLFPRRGHGFSPVPAQQAAAPNPALTFQSAKHLRMLFQRRGRVASPVPAQQAAPVNPALAFQPQRHLRLALAPRRGRGTVHVPGQQDAAPRQRQVRAVRLVPSRRGRVTPVPVAPVVAPAWVQPHRAPARALALIRRRFRQLLPWPQAVQPPFSVGSLSTATQSGINATSTYAPTGASSTSSGINATTTQP